VDYLGLIDGLINKGYLKTPLIIEAFREVNRVDFVPERLKNEVAIDAPLPIGFGQTISQPLTVAFMLELLQPQAGDRVLDIGSGSGWTTALLAYCAGGGGKIFAVERLPEIYEFGKKNISKYNYIEKGIVKAVCADASHGLAGEAPFDKILVSAAAEEIPVKIKKQLKIKGRLVIPVRNSIWLIERKSENEFDEQEFYGFSFVPLVSDQ
jgi:protein-L-isoaspartate(D-aspartate) O-methyltransferase